MTKPDPEMDPKFAQVFTDLFDAQRASQLVQAIHHADDRNDVRRIIQWLKKFIDDGYAEFAKRAAKEVREALTPEIARELQKLF